MFLRPLALVLLLSACAALPPGAETPAADRRTAECALLSRASARMGGQAPPGLTEGCPGTTARDTRPLAQQTASVRAANAAALPPGLVAGTRAEAVFRRMITHGVPPELAAALTADPAFAQAAR